MPGKSSPTRTTRTTRTTTRTTTATPMAIRSVVHVVSDWPDDSRSWGYAAQGLGLSLVEAREIAIANGCPERLLARVADGYESARRDDSATEA